MMMTLALVLGTVLGGLPGPVVQTAHPHIVFMIGEDEYHTWETLPAFARQELEPRGYRVTIINGRTDDKNDFPGLVEALRAADLLFLSTRRRTPPAAQLDAVRAYLASGRPLVGIRTACHAFALRPSDPPPPGGHATWQEFDPDVLGGHYTNHHAAGPTTTISTPAGAETHPILQSVRVNALIGHGSLYKVRPLAPSATPLLFGTIPGEPQEPVAWTHTYGPKHARVFYTSLGHPDDFDNGDFRKLLLNAVRWALGN